MRVFIILLFLIPLNGLAYQVDLKEWQLLDDSENLKLYSHKKQKGHKLSIQLKKAYYKDWHKASAQVVYKRTVASKKKMLSFLKIKNWEISSKKWLPQTKENPRVSRLEIKGRYTNSRNKNVEFHEIHEFSDGEKKQYLFTKIIP